MSRCELCKCEANHSHLHGNFHYAAQRRAMAEKRGLTLYPHHPNVTKRLVKEGIGETVPDTVWHAGGIGRTGYFSSQYGLKKTINFPSLLARKRKQWNGEAARIRQKWKLEDKREAGKHAALNEKALKVLEKFSIPVPEDIQKEVDCAEGVLVRSPEGEVQQAVCIRKHTYLVRDDKGYFLHELRIFRRDLQDGLDALIPRERRTSAPEVRQLWKRQGEFHFFPAIVLPEGGQLVRLSNGYPLERGSRHIACGNLYLDQWGTVLAVGNVTITAPDHTALHFTTPHLVFTAENAAD